MIKGFNEMRKSYLTFLVCICMIFSIQILLVQAELFNTPLKIMSYNTDCHVCDLKHENGASFEDRMKNLQDVVNRNQPDIMGVQELFFKKDVKEFTPDGFTAVYNDKSMPILGYDADACIIYNNTRFSVKDSGFYFLGRHDKVPIDFDPARTPREAQWALMVDHENDDFQFFFGTTHFDHGDHYHKESIFDSTNCAKMAPDLLDHTQPYHDQGLPVIYTGDFNSNYNSNAYDILTNASNSHNEGYVLKETWDLAKKVVITANTEPVPEYDHTTSIDHIFVSATDNVVVSEVSVDTYVYPYTTKDGKTHSTNPSDHKAIFTTLTSFGAADSRRV